MQNAGVRTSITISGDLIGHCRTLYELSLTQALTGKVLRHGINAFSPHALPAYVVAVASIEAFISESLLSSLTLTICKTSPLHELKTEWIDKLELKQRLLVSTKLLFDWSLKKDAQPYQDFDLLVKIRNDITHYKNDGVLPKYIVPMKDRNIFMKHPGNFHNPWASDVSCTEGIIWAHNTACEVVIEIIKNAPKDVAEVIAWNSQNFTPIPSGSSKLFFESHGIKIE